MTEPAIIAFQEQFHGRLMTRSRLRDMMGPDNPIFHLLESLCIQSEYVFEDEFIGTLNGNMWTVANSGGGGAPSNFSHSATLRGGQLEANPGTTDNADCSMISVGENWSIDNRPVMLTRLEPRTNITNSKFEVGFTDADPGTNGNVLVKDTPTSQGADYCVVVRDTDDDTGLDLVVDGTSPTFGSTSKVVGTSGVTWTINTMHNIMIAMNERDEQYAWVNGSLLGGNRANQGPDNDVTLAIWLSIHNRTNSPHLLRVDYVKVLAERVAL